MARLDFRFLLKETETKLTTSAEFDRFVKNTFDWNPEEVSSRTNDLRTRIFELITLRVQPRGRDEQLVKALENWVVETHEERMNKTVAAILEKNLHKLVLKEMDSDSFAEALKAAYLAGVAGH